MSDLVYLMEGEGCGKSVEARPVGAGERLELVVRGKEQEVVVVPNPVPAPRTRSPQKKQRPRRKGHKPRVPKAAVPRVVAPKKRVHVPSRPAKVVKVSEPMPRVDNELPYFAGDGGMIVKYAVGNDHRMPVSRWTKIAYTSVLDGMNSGVSVSGYNRRLVVNLKLTDEGFYKVRAYLTDMADPEQVRRSRGRRDGKRFDNITIDDYQRHGFFLKRREGVIVIQTPMVFELGELVDHELNGKKSVKPWDTSRRAEVYDALVTAYALLEPVLMQDIV
jgi:hypothetical protein